MPLALTSMTTVRSALEDHGTRHGLPLRAVNHLADTVCANPTQAGLFKAIADAFRSTVGVTRCSIFLPEPDSSLYRPSLSLGRVDYTRRVQNMVNGDDAYSREILERRQPVTIIDSLADPRVAYAVADSKELGVRSMMGLPITAGDEVLALVFLDTERERVEFSPEQIAAADQLGALLGAPLKQAQLIVDQNHSLVTATQENDKLSRLLQLGEVLESLPGDNLTISEFCERTSRTIRRPVVVYDDSWRVVAQSIPDGIADRIFHFGESKLRDHPTIKRELKRVFDGETRTLPATPDVGAHLRCIVAPIPLGPTNWGQLVVHEVGRPFQAIDTKLLHRAGTKLGSSLSHQNHGATSPRDLRISVLRDVLRGEGSAKILQSRAQAAGIATAASHRLCIITGPTGTDVPSSTLWKLNCSLERILGTGNVVAINIPTGVVALIPNTAGSTATHEEQVREAVGSWLRSEDDLTGCTAVVSASFTELTDCHDAYVEAQQAFRCINRFPHAELPRALSVSDFGAALAFVSSADSNELRSYARRHLSGLLDAGSIDELVNTLRVFLDSRNVRVCARSLDVHENTVRYRLSRIEKLTGLDLLTNTKDQLKAELSILVLRLTGQCSWLVPAKSAPAAPTAS